MNRPGWSIDNDMDQGVPPTPNNLIIIEDGMDLWFVADSEHRRIRLRHPSWEDVMTCVETFDDNAENGTIDNKDIVVGTYVYDFSIWNHVMTWYPHRGTPNGWVHTYLGIGYEHDVVAREDRDGTVYVYRLNYQPIRMVTKRPRPGMFFRDLEAVSSFNTEKLKLSTDPIGGDVVAEIDSKDNNGLAIVLYPDMWGDAMWIWVTGHPYR